MPKVKQIDIRAIFEAQTGHPLTEKIDVKPHPENTPPKSRRPRN
jgi:hypothetical protein